MRYLSHVDEYLTLKYKYKYKYFKMVLEYYSSTSTSTKYYISGNWKFKRWLMRKKHVESKRRHHICVHILQQTLTDLKSISLIHSLYEICNKAINKGTATIQKCRYTSLCNNDRSCVHAFGIMTVVVVDEARSSTNLLLSMQHSTASKRMLYSFRSLIKNKKAQLTQREAPDSLGI